VWRSTSLRVYKVYQIYKSTDLQTYQSTTYELHLNNIHIVESTTVYRHLVEQFGTRRSYKHRLVVKSSRKVGSILLLSFLLVHGHAWHLQAYDHCQDLQYIVYCTIYNQQSTEPTCTQSQPSSVYIIQPLFRQRWASTEHETKALPSTVHGPRRPVHIERHHERPSQRRLQTTLFDISQAQQRFKSQA